MRRYGLYFWPTGFLVASILIGCSYKLQLALFNNTGAVMSVHLGAKVLVAQAGESIQFDYPESAQAWMVRLSVEGCAFSYEMPKTLEHYPWVKNGQGPLKAQLERDMLIYILMPTATGIQPITGLGNIQQDGFPLRPAARDCSR